MNINSPIILTGIPRSGTSLIAQVLTRCDCFAGNVSPRSMCENIPIRDTIIHPYLQNIGIDINGQYPVNKEITSIPINWKEKINNAIKEQGYIKGKWIIKDSKIALMWSVWNAAYPNAKWVIVRRRTGDIIQSCLKTAYMKAFSNPALQKEIGVTNEEEGWRWWIHQYERKFVEMIEAGLNVKIIWPERMINGNYEQLYETLEWVGVNAKDDILQFIDPLLWNGRNKKKGVING